MSVASPGALPKPFTKQGAAVGFSYHPAVEKHARPLAVSLEAQFIEPCDVSSDDEIQRSAEKARQVYGEVDILVHAVAFADRAELEGAYYQTSRAGFHRAMDISVYISPHWCSILNRCCDLVARC